MAQIRQATSSTSNRSRVAKLWWANTDDTTDDDYNLIFRSTLRGQQQNPRAFKVVSAQSVSRTIRHRLQASHSYGGDNSRVRRSITGFRLKVALPPGALWARSDGVTTASAEGAVGQTGTLAWVPAFLFTTPRIADGTNVADFLYAGG